MGVNNSPLKAAEILENLSTIGKPQKTKSNCDILSLHVFFLLSVAFPIVFLLQGRNGPQGHSVHALCPFASQRPLLASYFFFLPPTEISSPFLILQGLYSFLWRCWWIDRLNVCAENIGILLRSLSKPCSYLRGPPDFVHGSFQ